MPLLVMKFGGTSVGSPDAIRRAAELARQAAKDWRVVVVSSAMSKVTDLLLDTMAHGESGDETTVEARFQTLEQKHVETANELLPADRREDFLAPFKDRKPSISLISATLGLNRKPSELGLTSYSTMLIPDWMTRFADYRDSAALFAEMPGERMPAACVVDYDRIDSGLAMDGVYPVNIVCPDRFTNWAGLDDPAYHARKGAWLDALIARLESEWPGFASAVVEKTMATARTLHDYLNTPEGAVYGFALEPPKGAPKGPPLNVQTSVDGLWLASAFAGFGGFTGAMGAGAAAARAALKHRKSAVGSSIDH